jgi:hypothetical protein
MTLAEGVVLGVGRIMLVLLHIPEALDLTVRKVIQTLVVVEIQEQGDNPVVLVNPVTLQMLPLLVNPVTPETLEVRAVLVIQATREVLETLETLATLGAQELRVT